MPRSRVRPTRSQGRPDRLVRARGILHAMEPCGVRRFVAVRALPVGVGAGGESVHPPELAAVFQRLLRDMHAVLAEMEDEIRRSTTEWTVVR